MKGVKSFSAFFSSSKSVLEGILEFNEGLVIGEGELRGELFGAEIEQFLVGNFFPDLLGGDVFGSEKILFLRYVGRTYPVDLIHLSKKDICLDGEYNMQVIPVERLALDLPNFHDLSQNTALFEKYLKWFERLPKFYFKRHKPKLIDEGYNFNIN
jgi:hypothetical protein